MNALVKQKHGPGHLELIDAEVPMPGHGEVQIEIRAAGICGTDIHIVHDTFPYRPPVILGHEFCGVISALGDDVSGLEPGGRVMAETTAHICGTCDACQSGDVNRCTERIAYGIHVNGGFAEAAVVHQRAIHTLPENVDFLMGAMTEPLAVCVHALMEQTQVTAGQLVLVLGPGPIGLLAAMVAKSQGAVVVVAGTERDTQRLALADTIGTDVTVRVETGELETTIGELSEGRGGADITVEAAGAAASIDTSLRLTRKGGTVVQLGLAEGPVTVDYSQISFREINVVGSFAHRWSSFDTALKLMSGNVIDVRPLISAVMPLTEGLSAFERAERGTDAKILLTPGDPPAGTA